MNDASIDDQVESGRKRVVASRRKFVRSMTRTRGSLRSRQSSCPYPTSTAVTLLRAALQQTIGEAAGRGADVERIGAADVDAKRQSAHARASLRLG